MRPAIRPPPRRGGPALVLAMAVLTGGAVPAAPPENAPPTPGATVVRVTVGLVQIDAVVTDGQGRAVDDLGPGDFVVKEGGHRREITHLSYVRLGPRPAGQPSPATEPSSPAVAPEAPASPPRGRMITLVVDDLNVSFEGIRRVRDALHRFIDERLASGDRVAILRTGGGTAAMEQFTSDTARLHAAVDGFRFNYMGAATVGGPATIDSQMPFGAGPQGQSPSGRQTTEGQVKLGAFRDETVALGTLGTLRWIVKGLAPFPGRKPVVVFSDGFRVFDRDQHVPLENVVRSLADEANRASVALYTVDTHDLSSDALRASDNVTYVGGADVARIPGQRALARYDAEESLTFMADQTGGLMVKGGTDVGRGLDRILDDQEGYYLIGYAPPPEFFETAGGRPIFHKIQVSVRRPGLRVRSRAGFYGVPDGGSTGDAARGERLAAALVSPFAAADLALRLQTLFVDDEKAGPSLRAMLRIDARDLTFVEKPGGGRQVVLDVVAVTFDAGGKPVDRKDQTFTIGSPRAEPPSPDTAFFYTLDLPVTKPGAYQFRVVVRDVASERLGAAGEVVLVPDVKAGRLALSSILVHGPAEEAPSSSAADGTQALVGRVTPGRPFEYAFQILNARRDPATGGPRLETQVRLWRGTRPIYEGPRTPLPVEHALAGRVAAGGRLSLGPGLEPGDYALQVVVTDRLAPAARSVATQWARLEAVR